MECLSSSALQQKALLLNDLAVAPFTKSALLLWGQHVKIDIKNTLIINDLFVYNLNCQYESSTV